MGGKVIYTAMAPRPRGAYSQGMTAGNLLCSAGMGPLDPDSGMVSGTTIQEQTNVTLRNLTAILTEAGMTWEHVIKVTVYLARTESDFDGFNATYAEFLGSYRPPRTTVGATLRGILVEIDVLAMRPDVGE